MTEIEHKEIENKLKKEYVGKFIWVLEDSGDFDKIVDVYVDYREEAQHMNMGTFILFLNYQRRLL